jgi:DNA-binding protein WhiA
MTHGKREFILRDQQGIVTFLSKMGLTGISLILEDKAILRTMRDQANRMRNCDTANIKKALKAAEEQTALAHTLLQSGLLSTLPPCFQSCFQSLIEARLEHPEESLAELGKRLSPPVTKSTVKYRWKRLLELLERSDTNIIIEGNRGK